MLNFIIAEVSSSYEKVNEMIENITYKERAILVKEAEDFITDQYKKDNTKETKSTFIIRCDQLDQLRAISYMERKMIKNVLEEALSLYIERYEKDNGNILLPKTSE